MATIRDLRKKLWDAYLEITQDPDYYGKSSEAHVSINYPSFWDCDGEEDFLKPYGIELYSYALGPSRSHIFQHGPMRKQVNYYTWEDPNPIQCAIEVVDEWLEQRRKSREEYSSGDD